MNDKKIFTITRSCYDEQETFIMLGPKDFSKENFEKLFNDAYQLCLLKIINDSSKLNSIISISDCIKETIDSIKEFGFEIAETENVGIWGTYYTDNANLSNKTIKSVVKDYCDDIKKYDRIKYLKE